MLLRVIAVGTRMPGWVDVAVDAYSKRMPPELRIDWKPVKAEPRESGGGAARCMAREAQRIREALPAGARLVVLDERAADLTSARLAERLLAWQRDARPVAIVIGGPDGIDPALKGQAEESLRLSSLTLPHALVRPLLAEQLYRAWTIAGGHPYHRE
ncbi:MAG: 23S rRNA (pseudouridine(1915)-N(3))-methyltransferase RlmH [Burkholderiaceae bacterium]|jgi:23S rRNA (pseudouridine1915-N3)-methyltransferase|nr:23S rRNA (pseudouridine(1915)-N(3))-methyltransferase RlmH [Burkholderiales bacterium]MCZ8107340.1 23S rRNA (pseudouridine(1915)-N(3))-methyltransferase RlmH [Burkholderiales bacterium]MCZ8339515.1 23S rRNA (pseudouridine(1915)-N(3))-methyltransferase RlmH [Burkholderiaceae bacterium]